MNVENVFGTLNATLGFLCEFFQLNERDWYTFFYICISHTFISKTKLKLAKNKTNAKHHPEAVFLLFENHLLFSSMLWSKSNLRYSQKCAKNKGVYFNKIIMIDCHENESENEK